MAAHYLDFERPIADLESKIEELSRLSETAGPGAFDTEIQALRDRAQALRKEARAAEQQLEKLTAERNAIDQAMFDPKAAQPALAKLTMTELMKRRADLEHRIAETEARWLEASEALEAALA